MSADECPPHWVQVHLREVVHKLVDGSHNPPPKQGAGLPMLSAVNIDGNAVNFSESHRLITQAAFDEEDRRTSISPGDILLTIVGAIGRAAVVPTTLPRFTIQRSVAVLSPTLVDSKFLMYQLEAPRCAGYLKDNARGTAQKGVYLRTLGEAPVWIAPLAEQRRIVAKIDELLSELDKGVESLTTAREQLKAYRQSALKHAFEGKLTADWRQTKSSVFPSAQEFLSRIQKENAEIHEREINEWKQATRIAESSESAKPIKPRKPIKPDKPSPYQVSQMCELPVPWIWAQLGDIAFVTKLAGFEYTKFVKYDGAGDLDVIKAENAGPAGFRETAYSRVRSETVTSLERSRLSGGELLMVFVGAGTGNVAMVPTGRAFFLGPNIGMMRITSGYVEPRYVELFLRSPQGRDLALSSVKAVAQPSLSMGTIRQIPVALPTLGEQRKIIEQLDALLDSADRLEEELETDIRASGPSPIHP